MSVFLIHNSTSEAVRNYARKLGKYPMIIDTKQVSPDGQRGWWDLLPQFPAEAEIYIEMTPNYPYIQEFLDKS
jgi:hypothetical protein